MHAGSDKQKAAQEAVLDAIIAKAGRDPLDTDDARAIALLSESFAWLVSQGQSHGGGVQPAQR